MDMQNVSSLQIPEGVVRTIHDKDNRLLWGRVAYNTKYVGDTIQNGTPTPDIPVPVQTVAGKQTVAVTGKNLYEGSQDFSGIWNNASAWETGTDTYNGLTVKKRSSAWQGINKNIYVKAGETYTFSLFAKAETARNVTIYTSGGSASVSPDQKAINVSNEWQKFSFTFTPSTSGTVRPRLENRVAYDTPTYICGYQLEQGTATDYEPFQGQSYPIDLQGKNLLDIDTLVAGCVSSNGTFSTAQTQAEMRSGFIWVQPNTTYTFSIQETTDTYPAWFGVGLYGDSNTSSFIRRDTNTTTTATSITFTTSATTNYVVVSARNMANATKAQVEEGSRATEYIAYNPIELCKIGDYQDYIYKSGDDWYVHKETFKSNLWELNWASASEGDTTNGISFYVGSGDTPRHYRNIGLSNCFERLDYSSDHTIINFIMFGETTIVVNIARSKLSSADKAGFVAWLTSNSAVAYYPIATPTDTQITDAGLIAQLEAIHEWLTRYGYNSTVSGNLPMTINKTNL